MELPLIGGFNDGKFIDPCGRIEIKMARPLTNDPVHRDLYLGFEYEIYTLETIIVLGSKVSFFLFEEVSIPEAFIKLVLGYKRYNKLKSLDLSK